MDRVAAPRSPGRTAMSEVVDPRRGSVRVSGDLTVQGADLLRGTVESLRRSGHDVVLIDLGDVRTADSAGLRDLHALERAVAADGGELLVVEPPAVPAPRG
jgi:anti-anti-sigma regulatory factor